MGSVNEFNKKAALGREAAKKYCKDWAAEIEARGKDLSEQLKANKIDKKVYNIKRSNLNVEIKDLNSCIEKANK